MTHGFGEGVLRAPRRGRRPPPLLSAVPRDGPSAPAAILAERGWEAPALAARAAAARRALVAARVGGEWWHAAPPALPELGYAVVVLGDGQIAEPVTAMLDRAMAENPSPRLAIVASRGAGRGLRARLAAAAAQGAVIIDRACDPWGVVERAGRVYCAGGETGFLALVAGVPVTAIAPDFYTGWGATDDAAGVPRRAFDRSVDEIFAAACLIATRCRDPFGGGPAAFEEALETLALWRRIEEQNRSIAVCVGMSFWKRRRVAEFVRSATRVPPFRRSAEAALRAAARHGGAVAGWASRLPSGLAETAARRGIRLIQVEDGFVRSKGLGADFLPPASLVFDHSGIYYDPRRDSDLARLLRETQFAPELVARAERLAARLVAQRITKYNLDGDMAEIATPPGRRRILVPGQVEDDLSIVCGTGTLRSNIALLAETRRFAPDALILYKPHPDVAAGHRAGVVPQGQALRFADIVVENASVARLLDAVDEVHTMTSLAGFEALLRGRQVVVYGRPFYAGWGLTDDRPPFERGRRLSLAELIAGALILYPRYLDPLTRLPCGPEILIERLDRPELWRPGVLVLLRRLQGLASRRLRAAAPALPLRLQAGPRP